MRGPGGAAAFAMSGRWVGLWGLAALMLLVNCSRIVILNDPLSAAEHNDLGVAYERQGLTDLAAKEYRRALRREPNFTRARVNLGNIEAAAGRWADAERTYRRALEHAPDDPDALNNLAVALLRQGRKLDEAESLALRAVTAAAADDSVAKSTLAEVRAARDKR